MSRAALMAEAKRWREIAERVAVDELQGHGLCYETDVYGYAIYQEMTARVDQHLRVEQPVWNDVASLDDVEPNTRQLPFGSDERKDMRILAALFLALECDDEAKSLSGEDEASASLGMKKV